MIMMTRIICTLWQMIAIMAVCIITLWICLYIWVHMPIGVFSYIMIVAIGVLSLYIIIARLLLLKNKRLIFYYKSNVLFGLISVVAILIYFSMEPSNDRLWYDEMVYHINYQKNDNNITINNVRNFNWHDDGSYDIHWQSRTYDIDKLATMDFIVSIWDNENIAHTMLSFGFSDGQYLTLSVETRKEIDESFSSLGGFFRKYELIFIAADEKDIIYTRSNVRKEDVYIYPIKYDKAKMQALLLNYLQTGESLNERPRWYHTILSNCTTVIYDLVRDIDIVPLDYRLLASGRLPTYLYEYRLIDNNYSMSKWRQMAYINPKVNDYNDFNPITSQEYSRAIRQNLPPMS